MKFWCLLTVVVSLLTVGSYTPSQLKSAPSAQPEARTKTEQAMQSTDAARWRQAQTSHWRYVMLKN